MSETLPETRRVGGCPVMFCPSGGPPLREAADVIGDAFHHGVTWIAVPVERLDPDFFRLRTGVAGDFLQKFANYRLRLALVGDVSRQVAASDAFHALVRECNRGTQCWFVPDLGALGRRLAAA
ncbi:hypothetical protein GCM10007079_20030 [Nocardiopsis terrae]|uniref:DUF4180 domain-containing protein n=1 Tax=Nocardiopsis terrae TaxID=372655 RepID=A0ABR9HHG6_9ACTN|nr:DUF4180 domain-containing protein [Nocardiopsis terrae]MBE1458381.1 hypothetical protein [Nocardiopsis terrae]GHC80804.1 hypothetical protein GCM10007079_20030 [Nocardiopsis terrae]